MTVISPMGTKSQLLGPRPFDDIKTGFSLFGKWPMMSVHFWGENPTGKWILKVHNDSTNQKARFSKWALEMYGIQSDPNKVLP